MYYIYIIRCKDNSLYTGITTDLERRFNEHKNKIGAKYTKRHEVDKIEIAWSCENRSIASKLEYHLKKLSKKEKEAIIQKKEILFLEIRIDNYTLVKV